MSSTFHLFSSYHVGSPRVCPLGVVACLDSKEATLNSTMEFEVLEHIQNIKLTREEDKAMSI